MIEFNEFSFRYREGVEPVVRDITLAIPDGCFVGITGAAGSGKSTLTYAINGIIPHCYPGDFYGSVTVEGLDTVDASLTDLSAGGQCVSGHRLADGVHGGGRRDSLRPGELRGAT